MVDASNVPSKYPPTVPVFLVIRDTSCLKFVDIMRNEPNISLLVECGGTLSSFLERVNRNYITRDECYAQLSQCYSAQFKQELNRFFYLVQDQIGFLRNFTVVALISSTSNHIASAITTT